MKVLLIHHDADIVKAVALALSGFRNMDIVFNSHDGIAHDIRAGLDQLIMHPPGHDDYLRQMLTQIGDVNMRVTKALPLPPSIQAKYRTNGPPRIGKGGRVKRW